MDISIDARKARITALAQLLAGATLCVRTGSKPATSEAKASGDEVVSIALPKSLSANEREITVISSPIRALATAQGVPGYYRIEKAGRCVIQGNVGPEFPMPTEEIEQGRLIEIRSWTITDESN